MSSLDGRVAIVTGAASYHGDESLRQQGQGGAVAARLAQLGAAVVLADLNGPAAEKRAEAIRAAGGDALAVAVDVTDEAQVERMVRTAVNEFGRLDVQHTNAANLAYLFDPGDPELTAMMVEGYRAIHDTLVLGTMLCCKHAIPALIATGGGSIICTTSISGEMGELNLTCYGSAKAAVNQVVRSVSAQYGSRACAATRSPRASFSARRAWRSARSSSPSTCATPTRRTSASPRTPPSSWRSSPRTPRGTSPARSSGSTAA